MFAPGANTFPGTHRPTPKLAICVGVTELPTDRLVLSPATTFAQNHKTRSNQTESCANKCRRKGCLSTTPSSSPAPPVLSVKPIIGHPRQYCSVFLRRHKPGRLADAVSALRPVHANRNQNIRQTGGESSHNACGMSRPQLQFEQFFMTWCLKPQMLL